MSEFETEAIEHVLYVNSHPNGKAVTIGAQTKNGRQIAWGVSAEEAAKIVDGITRTKFAIGLGYSGAVLASVDAVDLDADSLGRAVVLTFRAGGMTLGSFALPTDLAQKLGPRLELKAAEVSKADAALSKTMKN